MDAEILAKRQKLTAQLIDELKVCVALNSYINTVAHLFRRPRLALPSTVSTSPVAAFGASSHLS